LNFTIDNERRLLLAEEGGVFTERPLYSPEAFELLSREWVRVGWALQQYYTFSWLGQPILQLPEDLIRLQDVIYRLKPDVLIECGVCDGGSLLYHATLMQVMGKGRVVGIDIQIRPGARAGIEASPLRDRIQLIESDSAAPEVVARVRGAIQPGETVMVILDSDHTRRHVARELEAWAPAVTPGSCLLVADGIMRDLADVPGGNPSWVDDNPATAARDFLAAHPEFELRQPAWQASSSPLHRNVTYFPDGWLWRKADRQ
jgi:cephalosporin hydroxylase